jgi:hypothetical protein
MRTSSARFGVFHGLGVIALVAAGLGYGCAASSGEPLDDDSGTGRPRIDGSAEAAGYDAGYGYTDDAGDPNADAGTSEDSGAGEGGNGEGGTGDGGTTSSCVSANACPAARDVGTVSGDTNPTNNVVTAKGTKSEWVKVRVTEDKSGVGGQQLKVKASLASPTGTNYDIHLYVDHGADNVECNNVTIESKLPAGQIDQVIDNWGEGTIANGSDDSRTVSIYVDNQSGPCGPGHEWTLTITGNP